MKYLFILSAFTLCLIHSVVKGNNSGEGNQNRTYHIKYILDENGYAIPSETTFTVTPSRIYVTRNGQDKYWDCEYKGTKVDEPVKGEKVIFHVYYLTNKHIYVIVSDYKLIKHDDVFYYRIVIDGQTQLAL